VVDGAVGSGDFIVRNDGTDSLIASLNTTHFAIDSVVDALADEGLLTVLAEPNLTALSGEHADFLAGGEFPIPVSQENDTITIEFKRFGVFLSFMPVVLDSGRISLRVAPEVSQLSSAGAVTLNGFVIPALTTRKAVTTVELGSGQSFAIAGLIQNDVTQSLQKFPGIGDVPVLGQLFRSDNFQRNETELAIIVTPYLVRPSAPQQLVDPTLGVEPPNDEDRYVYGRNYGELTGAASAPGIVPARRRDGGGAQTGFMLD
jgi:pilus assembly protein CpaC